MTLHPAPRALLGLAFILTGAASLHAVGFEDIEKKAQDLVGKPFQPLSKAVPANAASMEYTAYQAIRFNTEKAIWQGLRLPFRLEMFYRAFLFPERIKINVIKPDGTASEVPFSTDLFTIPSEFGKLPEAPADYGFAGLKVFYQFPDPRTWEEMIIFQGASYFRVPAAGQFFGLSARGLAINTAAQDAPEEFPAFTEFWVRQPKEGSGRVTIYALLDGPSVTGAYEFVARPGARTTTVDVKASLFFRGNPSRVGYAPLTSMFWFGENNYRRFTDYRPEVHDSDGLLIQAADGHRLWRPLQTVTQNLVDEYSYADAPKGFGLLQRDRAFSSSVDIEARYHKRPSLWVEPATDWKNGSVVLWQIPTVDEYHDNIVAYWKPDVTPKAGEKRTLQYRLLTTSEEPTGLPRGGQVVATYILPSYGKKDRFLIMVDFAWGGDSPAPFKTGELPRMEIQAEDAQVLSQYVKANPDARSWRLHTVVQFPSEHMRTKMHARLLGKDGWQSEDWTYTFVPQE